MPLRLPLALISAMRPVQAPFAHLNNEGFVQHASFIARLHISSKSSAADVPA